MSTDYKQSSITEGSNEQWIQFAIVSAFFFFITASTFTSFGVVLPYMIEDLSWNWSQAGTGFSLLALLVGLAGTVPAFTLRRFGVKVTFAIGGIFMAVGFVMLALANGLTLYFLGSAVLGFGYTLCAIVPGVHIITAWLPLIRSSAIGWYLTIGGLGGVAGPLVVTTIVSSIGSWRAYWWVATASVLVLTAIAALKLRDNPLSTGEILSSDHEDEKTSDRVFKTKINWRFSEAIRTPQYYVIVFSLTLTMFVGLSVNAVAVGHMTNLGVAATFAAFALSGHAAVNSVTRALGGTLATRIDPKWLLAAALISEIIGSLALVSADNMFMIILFAVGEGFGFGMCLLATTVMMVNYFGKTATPALLGTMHMVTTAAMIGPVLGGYIFDTTGSFALIFQGYAVVLLLMLVVVIFMRPPVHVDQTQVEVKPAE